MRANIDQNVCIIQVKLGLIQIVSMEPEVFLPSKIIGHVIQPCNHVVCSPHKNNSIKKIYKLIQEEITLCIGNTHVLKLFSFDRTSKFCKLTDLDLNAYYPISSDQAR